VFFLGIGLIFTHELDAMVNNEWRVLPLTSWLCDEFGKLVFLVAHIPISSIVAALISSDNVVTRNRSRLFISTLLALHGLLHAAFMMNQSYEFESVISNILIFCGAACGAIYLLLDRIQLSRST
jgi:hypothetical protein